MHLFYVMCCSSPGHLTIDGSKSLFCGSSHLPSSSHHWFYPALSSPNRKWRPTQTNKQQQKTPAKHCSGSSRSWVCVLAPDLAFFSNTTPHGKALLAQRHRIPRLHCMRACVLVKESQELGLWVVESGSFYTVARFVFGKLKEVWELNKSIIFT